MTEYRSILERAGSNAPPIDLPMERILQRRDRKRRNHRVAATVIGVAAFILPAFGLVWLLGSEPGPVTVPAISLPPTVSLSPSPFTERFDSPLNGLSIGYPSGWETRAATERWGHTEVDFDAPDVDVIFDPMFKGDLYIAVVSEPFDGTSARDWIFGDAPFSAGLCTSGGGGGGDDTIHGIDGDIYGNFWDCDEPDGAGGSYVTFATATRGYIIYLYVGDEHAAQRLQATYDGDWIEAVLKAVVLPEDAVDASGLSEP